MTCPSCARENSADAAFCAGCGNRLGQEFDRTRAPSAGEPALASHAPLTVLEGERKQVTVLFADVKGSMDLQEGLDPEEWHGVMDRFMRLLTDGVHRYEGTVDKFTGDGIMALFGAPVGHEDHAQRACHAALHLSAAIGGYAEELQRTKGLIFHIRIGLNSGEVVVGAIGDNSHMEYTAVGHTVGLAQRMESLAEPGIAYLSEHTTRLVRGYFRLRDLGPLTVKGAREPVGVAALEGIGGMRTSYEVARSRGLSGLVGRSEEIVALEAALARAEEGNGQVVGVVGEAGVGKSRLCEEFAASCVARGIGVYRAHGVSHGRTLPFLPALELAAWALPVHALIALLSGHGEGAIERATAAVELAQEIGSPFHSVLNLQGLGTAYLAAGRGKDAIRPLQEGLALARGRHVALFEESSLLALLADAYLDAGEADLAVRTAGDAVAVARAQNARVHECQALITHARVLRCVAAGDPCTEIASDLAAAAAAIKEVGALAWQPFVHEEHARLALLQTDTATWERELGAAHRLFASMGATGHAARLAKELS